MEVNPTNGFDFAECQLNRVKFTLFDLGGGPRIRGIWKHYYADSFGMIFVVDSTDVERLSQSQQALEKILSNPRMQGKPALM